jgi:N-acetylneuraminate synthase
MDGPDHAASLEPQGFKKMVRDIRQVAQALGTGQEKFISRGEILNREVLGKSLVARRRILPGEKVTADMVAVKGPALGLSPQNYTRLLGRTIQRVIEEDEPFLDRDLGIEIKLDLEHTLPMDFGFTVRFRDFEGMLAYQPRTLVDLCSLDERHRIASCALLQKTINLTRRMAPYFVGTPKVVIHPGAMSLDHPIKERDQLYENLRRSVNELDYAGVELLLENLPPHPWYFGGQWLTNAFMDAYEIRDFITSLGLNFCYDSSHHKLYCNWAKVDLYEQLQVLLPHIGHLHLSDGAGLDGEGLQIGEGAIDWVHFFRVLGNYHGTMIPEIWRGHQRGGEGFLIAIQRLSQAYFAAHGQEQKA